MHQLKAINRQTFAAYSLATYDFSMDIVVLDGRCLVGLDAVGTDVF